MKKYTLLIALFLIPAFAHAALININTADAAALDTLPGIGPSKAAAIVDYRNINGPFAKIEDIQNVSGIGTVTYSNIESLITVSGSTVSETQTTTSSAATATPAPTLPTVPTTSKTASLTLSAGGDRTVIVGAPVPYAVSVTGADGKPRTDAILTWSFGDGTSGQGTGLSHTYYAQGDYAVVVHGVTSDGADVYASFVASAIPLSLRVTSVSTNGISIENPDTRTVDLSNWQLMSGQNAFKIPDHTQILAGKTVMFSTQVTGLPFVGSASLLFPSGVVAVSGPVAAAVVQPVSASPSLSQKQTVETTSNAHTTNHADEPVLAPAAQASLAAVGAALPATTTIEAGEEKSFLSSKWSWGLVGALIISAGTFILL